MELGIGMFGDLAFDQATGKYRDPGVKIREILEQVKFMDEVGIDVFAMGEHHRPDYAVSSPEIVLAAAASITKNIKLASGVTVLSSSEPVKVYEDFATLDLISDGRAEIYVGRGSFIESFPLYGYSLNDYEELFEEKLGLLLKINSEENITWSGRLRAPMKNQTVYPRAKNGGKLPIWRAVGGTPQSVQSAAELGLPLIVAIIGGMPVQFRDLIEFYKQEYKKAGHDVNEMQIAVHSHTFVSNDPEVIDGYFHNYKSQMDRIGSSRGWAPYTKMQYEGGRSKNGALFIGTAKEVADKIAYMKEIFGITRFIGHMDVGDPAHEIMMKSIELFGKEVKPVIEHL
ncbi:MULTISPECIES: LLM class flavin-dependent oxidoreductase [Chryseobacterium]|uniref:LLM family oxidoreductase n=1 Tax=Chryseobacterium camelliae TaxID=1265445 RepID=A0ABU0TCS4_9FLAO|nr:MULTISPECIES: LLM class flavin-dependent oxidoreductase [Chryseobacterium]MDT3407341.1 putative LLM family oxidoreductase [Pseudacidovorax intermedius]MDQ1094870.1 putative LLM family oxidoreductase [Chryseobacterium camelliae]MDQ1098810.1 putative LLM family oxidoreductase [Chryseobacterium sp. SORGH_AS_1048]MDR6086161.1 putative LLM family oxidoreductase [Chryseobacterium sp. SORGH_AS_0909]MDR6130531.1 putative LLM family oxidoreductase [Chryseobacterium sp. SORGH_AS_1175]